MGKPWQISWMIRSFTESYAHVDNVIDGGLGNTASGKQLILGHFMLLKKLPQPFTDCLIQLHKYHHLRRVKDII